MSPDSMGEEPQAFDLRSELEQWSAATAQAHAAERSLRPPPPKADAFSVRLPSQLTVYLPKNWTGGDSGHHGEWLRCLKATEHGDRQFIWNDDAVAGVVTFAGWVRGEERIYEGWGSITHLPRPVSRARLRLDRRTRPRFNAKGIHAFEGLPIRLAPAVASAVIDLAGGLGPTAVPLDEPDYNDEFILWVGPRGLVPEAFIEAAVAATPRLWRELGFALPPRRQVNLGSAGRVDLIHGDVVGEAKRAVTLKDGPDQIERYLDYLHLQRGRPREALKGVLLQVAETASERVIKRVRNSEYQLELWAVIDDDDYWVVDRLA